MKESYQAHQQQCPCFEYLKQVLGRLNFIAGKLNVAVEKQQIKESWEISSPCSRLSVHDHAESSASAKVFRLHFECRIPTDGLYTFIELTRQHAEVKVEVRDSLGSIVEVGNPQSPVKIKIFALEDRDEHSNSTTKDFDKNIAEPRRHKGPLLKGNCEFSMSNGVVVISSIAFTDNSSCRSNKNFRFGARVVDGLPPGVEIRDAISEPFRVKERRTMKIRHQNSTSKQAESPRGYSHTATEHPVMNAITFDNMQAGQLGSSLTLNPTEQGVEMLSRQLQALLNNTMSSGSQYWSTTGIMDVTGSEAAMDTNPHGSSVSPMSTVQVLTGIVNATTPQDQVISSCPIIQDFQLNQRPQLGFSPRGQVQDFDQSLNTRGVAAKRPRSC